MKAACLAYNTTVHSSTGQTPFFATFRREAIMPVHWIYPIPKADGESELSDWTETIQECFQTAYAGMREKQAEVVRQNAQYYTPLLNSFEVGQWVWLFDPKIIPGSCDKLRSYWVGPYKIVRKIAPALVDVIAIYKNGKTRIVNIDALKEFRGENNNHGYTSDPSHPENRGEDVLLEIPSIPTDLQLQRNLISIPARGEYPPSPPPTATRSDLRGSSETRSIEMGKDVKIDQYNEIPAVQEGIRGNRERGNRDTWRRGM